MAKQRRRPTEDAKPGNPGNPYSAWFLGPKAENSDRWLQLLDYVFRDYLHWRRNYVPKDRPAITPEDRRNHQELTDELHRQLDLLLGDLKAHYPFFSPRYAAHMLSEQSLPSVLGYFAGMLYNPNNVTDEAAPVTVTLELSFGRTIAQMLGFDPDLAWAHITSGGTVATLEALWIARMVQFVPLMVRHYCESNRLPLQIVRPDETVIDITKVDWRDLLALTPSHAATLVRTLAGKVVKGADKREDALKRLTQDLLNNPFNPATQGFVKIASLSSLQPVIFAPSSCHYSIYKAANVLGYGERASVRLIDVDSCFRMSIAHLSDQLGRVTKEEYVAAVVGVVGTTEEGAIDPIDRIVALRRDHEAKKNSSFWIHTDAAWGGYFCSAIRGNDDYARKSQLTIGQKFSAAVEVEWPSKQCIRALQAIGETDSVTVDPHKMGYVPYPAGVVAFENGLVRELVVQEAPYISPDVPDIKLTEPAKAVGPYILEGSKPGAAAAACYLAAQAIPLNSAGHGALVAATAISSRRFYEYLQIHSKYFPQIHAEVFSAKPGGPANCPHPFSFIPLCEPDTNIVCFVTVPRAWQGGRLVDTDVALDRLNSINLMIHEALDIPKRERGTITPHGRQFFISKTELRPKQYPQRCIEEFLGRLGVSPVDDYSRSQLTVLRSTIMNPVHEEALRHETDYLYDFLLHLHKVAWTVIDDLVRRGGLATAQ